MKKKTPKGRLEGNIRVVPNGEVLRMDWLPATPEPTGICLMPRRKGVVEAFLQEINSVQHSPRFQAVVTHGFLELLVNTLIEHHCKHGKKIVDSNRDYPQSVKLVLLHEKRLITNERYRMLDAFRDVRNKAVHSARFELTPKVLGRFSGMLGGDHGAKLDDPENFNFLCCEAVFGLWNDHATFFTTILDRI